MIFIAEYIVVIYCMKSWPNWPSISFWNLKSLYFTFSHLLPLVVLFRCSRWTRYTQSLYSIVVLIRSLALTRCHSLYHTLSFVVICFTTRCHSLSLCCTTCCDSTYLPRLFCFINCYFNIINRIKQCIIFCNTSFLPFVGTWTSDCCSKVLCSCFSF